MSYRVLKPFAISILLLAFHFLASGQKQGADLIDSLLKHYNTKAKDTTTVNLLNEISYAYYTINPTMGILYGNYELKLAREIGWKKGVAMAYTSLGTNYWALSSYDTALEEYSKAITIYKDQNFLPGIATLEMNSGTIYLRQGKYPEALGKYFLALKSHEQLGDKENMAICYFNIGNVYLQQQQFSDALRYYNNSLKIFESIGDKNSAATVTGNIGNVYYSQGSYSTSLRYFSKALDLNRALGNIPAVAMLTGNIGSVHIMMTDFKSGLDSLHEALKLYEKLGDSYGLTTVYTEIGEALFNLAKDSAINLQKINSDRIPPTKKLCLEDAQKNLLKATEIGRRTGNTTTLQAALERLSEVQTTLGNDKAALQSYKESVQIKDSLYNTDNTKKLTQLEEKYKADKQLEVQKSVAKKREYVIASGGISLLLIAGVSFFFYRWRLSDKFRLQLNALKQEALNAQMSDHFIGNAMDSINHFMQNNDNQKASAYLIKFSRLIRNVLENAQQRLIPVSEDLSILRDYLDLEKLRFPENKFNYHINIHDSVNSNSTLIPPMVFQTLAENAIKHGFKKNEGGTLTFGISKQGNKLVCTVEDNGVGRKASYSSKDPFSKRVSYGGSLAEQLVKTASKYGKETSYKIVDLFDKTNSSTGTQVQFSIPYITENYSF